MTTERLEEIVRRLELRLVHSDFGILIATKFAMDGTIERDFKAETFHIETQYSEPDALALFKELAAAGLISDYPSGSTVKGDPGV